MSLIRTQPLSYHKVWPKFSDPNFCYSISLLSRGKMEKTDACERKLFEGFSEYDDSSVTEAIRTCERLQGVMP
jgi:hypothetical protein